MNERSDSGLLQVVATPLGNLEDLSPRGRRALENADSIAVEDTRRTGRLLDLLGLPKKPLLSYYAPREVEKAKAILRRLEQGDTIALVTDGGTPGVSDPGSVLVAAAMEAGIRVEPVPGPSAVALALSVSSFAGERFVFEGFLPPKEGARRARLSELTADPRSLVFYEAPHRLREFLRDAAHAFGSDRRATVVREATKLHEEIVEGTLAELSERFAEGGRGEFVLVVQGSTAEPDEDQVVASLDGLLGWALEQGLSAEGAARSVARLTGRPRNPLTRRARELAEESRNAE